MVLGFKKQFVEKILNGSKIHTIREDKHRRWKKGMVIHYSTGVRTPNYSQFHEGICTGIEFIHIDPAKKHVYILNKPNSLFCNNLNNIEIQRLAENDGFDTVDDFWKWFDKPFEGVLIHWTEKIYR